LVKLGSRIRICHSILILIGTSWFLVNRCMMNWRRMRNWRSIWCWSMVNGRSMMNWRSMVHWGMMNWGMMNWWMGSIWCRCMMYWYRVELSLRIWTSLLPCSFIGHVRIFTES